MTRQRGLASLTRRQFAAAVALTLGSLPRARAQEALANRVNVPVVVTGVSDPNLRSFDDLMTSFVSEHRLPGAALAVTKDSRLVYARGFGYADTDKKDPVQPASLFRIASVSKPMTAVAVLQLVERGKLRLDDKAFEIVKYRPHLEPGAKVDPRLRQITVLHLLQHRAGWDRDESFEPVGRPRQIAQAMKIRLPVRTSHVVQYMMGKPLDFDPGQRYAYSNLGYLVLGKLIEAVTRETYENHVRKEVLAPLGITAMRLARGAVEQRAKGEVKYYDAKKRTGTAVVGPQIGRTVPLADGAMNIDAFEAHGGWIGSAVDLARFAVAFDDSHRCKVLHEESIRLMSTRPEGLAGHEADGKPKPMHYGCGWFVRPVGNEGKVNRWHTGGVAGSSALLVCRADRLNWAVLFNTEGCPNGKSPAANIDALVHDAAAKVKVWPETDLFEQYSG